MKIKSEVLKECLSYLSSLQTKTNVIDATKFIYISCSEGMANFVYFDGFREGSISAEVESKDDEVMCVDFLKLTQKVGIAPDGVTIGLALSSDKATLTIGKSRTKIAVFDHEAYPRFTVDNNGVLLQCKSSDMLNAISKVKNAIPTNDSRAMLNGVCFDVKDKKLTVVGSNGQRLNVCDVDCQYDDLANFQSIMPVKSIAPFLSMIHSEDVSIFFTDSKIMANSGNRVLMVPKLDSKYPNWRAIFDSCKAIHTASYSASDLKYAIRSAMITSNHQFGGIEIEICKGSTNFMSSDESGETFEPIESDSDFEYRFAMSGNFLNQAISNIDGGVISIGITDEDPDKLRPLKITEGSYTAIISPIRL